MKDFNNDYVKAKEISTYLVMNTFENLSNIDSETDIR